MKIASPVRIVSAPIEVLGNHKYKSILHKLRLLAHPKKETGPARGADAKVYDPTELRSNLSALAAFQRNGPSAGETLRPEVLVAIYPSIAGTRSNETGS